MSKYSHDKMVEKMIVKKNDYYRYYGKEPEVICVASVHLSSLRKMGHFFDVKDPGGKLLFMGLPVLGIEDYGLWRVCVGGWGDVK